MFILFISSFQQASNVLFFPGYHAFSCTPSVQVYYYYLLLLVLFTIICYRFSIIVASYYYYYYYYYLYYQYIVLQLSLRQFLMTRHFSRESYNQQPRANRMLSPYMFKTLLSILAAPNKTDFCTIRTFNLIPSVSIHPLKPLLMHPRAPTTIGTTSTFFSDQSLFSSLFKF